VKAAVFPLIKKAGMPEKAADIYRELKAAGIAAAFSQQGAIGRRYRQHDEIGTPFCITVDGDTLDNGTVTIRDRDSGIPSVLMGFGLPDDALHSPNEKFSLENYEKGTLAVAHFFDSLSRQATHPSP
jgi:histidyl-tRNA synthetase